MTIHLINANNKEIISFNIIVTLILAENDHGGCEACMPKRGIGPASWEYVEIISLEKALFPG